MNRLLQSSQFHPKNNPLLAEIFSDYGLETILSELIEFVLEQYPDQLHCAVISAYLIPAKNYVSVLNNREYYKIESNYPNFTKVEEPNG